MNIDERLNFLHKEGINIDQKVYDFILEEAILKLKDDHKKEKETLTCHYENIISELQEKIKDLEQEKVEKTIDNKKLMLVIVEGESDKIFYKSLFDKYFGNHLNVKVKTRKGNCLKLGNIKGVPDLIAKYSIPKAEYDRSIGMFVIIDFDNLGHNKNDAKSNINNSLKIIRRSKKIHVLFQGNNLEDNVYEKNVSISNSEKVKKVQKLVAKNNFEDNLFHNSKWILNGEYQTYNRKEWIDFINSKIEYCANNELKHKNNLMYLFKEFEAHLIEPIKLLS